MYMEATGEMQITGIRGDMEIHATMDYSEITMKNRKASCNAQVR